MVVLSLILKKIFTCDQCFVILWGFQDCHFHQFRTINAYADIISVLEIVPNWMKEAYSP